MAIAIGIVAATAVFVAKMGKSVIRRKYTGFSVEEVAVIQDCLMPETCQKGRLIFRKGDNGRDVYLISKGSVSVFARLPMRKRFRRINK